MNEWYAKDMSCKMRSTLKIKNSQGYAIGRPPLGYTYDEMDKKRWAVDEEGAQIVRYIFELRKQGESMNKIAKILKKQKVYIPSAYAAKKGIIKPTAKPPLNEYLWNHGMIQRILTNQSYVGDVVNFRTYSKSFKLKNRIDNARENWQIHKDVHEPIIGREFFEEFRLWSQSKLQICPR